ncbi:MAG TPA: PfkB family carbohydrate kinase [Candidatus Sulfotelmatobacter sp.]|nr:PfkB family carbohydrate kinase [Candidatus Sulfotelmatobacter sp.]
MSAADQQDAQKAYPLLGSIQNSVGYGFLGNETVVAIANRLRVRTVTVPTAYASARGGVEGRSSFVPDLREFRRGVEFLIARDPNVLVIGYLAQPDQVDVVADALERFQGLVVLDPVLGSYEKGLFVPVETARRIRDALLPKAEVVTPNRFEAEVLLDLTRVRGANERVFLDGFAERGPQTAIITSFVREAERRTAVTAFSNGYVYEKITSPFYPAFPGYGAGDALAGAVAALLTAGASPWAATMLATALASLAVERTTGYGSATVDPVAALDLFRPLPYLTDEACKPYAERFGVTSAPIPVKDGEGARLKFAPPKNQIVY